jgi:hypothetical protein
MVTRPGRDYRLAHHERQETAHGQKSAVAQKWLYRARAFQ